MVDARNIDGRPYPPPHRDWGGFAEGLLPHVALYGMSEAFLRGLSAGDASTMQGYRAEHLGEAHRDR